MKKIILASSLISSCLISSAYAEIQRPSFNGFYAGVGAGFIRSIADIGTNFSVSQELQAVIPIVPVPLVANLPLRIQTGQSLDQYADSAIGNILVGYGYQFGKRYYAGIEGFANLAHRDFNSANQDLTHTSNIDSTVFFNAASHSSTDVRLNPLEYGADFRAGVITDSMTTLIYGKIGAAFNKIDMTTSNTATANFSIQTPGFNVASPNVVSAISASDDKNVVGLRLGLGVEQLISCHWSVRADYTYTNYGDLDVNAIGNVTGFSTVLFPDDPAIRTPVNIVPITNGITQNANVHVSANAFTLGLSYYF